MTIISKGYGYGNRSKPWIGWNARCDKCGSIFRLNKDNPDEIFIGGHSEDYCFITCPNCGATAIVWDLPDEWWHKKEGGGR